MGIPATKLFKLNKVFARREHLPVYAAGRVLIETQRALYLYGHGSTEVQTRFSACCVCGMTLSHPGSIMLGIGPYCLGDLNLRDQVIKNKSQAEVDAIIGKAMLDMKVDNWIPKSCVLEVLDTDEVVEVPTDHPKLKPANNGNGNGDRSKRTAKQVQFQGTGGPAIKIEFQEKDRNKFYELVANVKNLPGKRFVNDATGKYWVCPLSVEAVEKLKAWGFDLDNNLEDFHAYSKANVEDMEEIEVPGLRGKLLPFQEKGVAFIEHKRGHALVADEMGLGKTIQALAWLQLHPELRPAIIVVPASLKLNWAYEIQKWMTAVKAIQVLSGTAAVDQIVGDVVIINYDIVLDWLERLQTLQAKVLVVDEIHFIKNSKAKRTKAVKMLGKNIPHIIGLSGTPIVNRPVEALNAIQLIEPTIFPNSWAYLMKFCDAHNNGYGWDFSGASNTEELHNILVNTIMIRRLKKDVLPELPEKRQSVVPMELTNAAEYRKVEQHFIDWVREHKGDKAAWKASRAEQLSKIEALKQTVMRGKMPNVLNWAHDFLESSDGKIVIMAIHKETINTLMAEFGDIAVKVDGSVPNEGGARQRAVDRFQTDPKIRVFVGNLKAAGVGWTLTAAYNMAVLELPWTPGDLSQGIDRIHRIGQVHGVNIYLLLAAGTIEERLAGILDSKKDVLSEVLDGESGKEETSILNALLESYAS